MKIAPWFAFILALVSSLLVSSLASADEGMWPFDHVPFAAINARHDVNLNQAWLDHVRLSTVRLSNCTASFVSKEGLILTNHHCSASCLSDLSTPQSNLLANGFAAKNRDDERRCPTQIADVLVASNNVTAKISAAIQGLNEQAANDRRKQVLAELERACEADASHGKFKCESVTLYGGGEYFIYKYKRYTDVRLVFAPEQDIAAFGGDPDNFQYPRWCLDMSVLRAYENGKAVNTANFLRLNFDGPKAGEAVFVSGHPGSTERLLTVAQLLEQRNVSLPDWLLRASELRGRYIEFGKTGSEQQRIVANALNGLENSIKVRHMQLEALLDDARMRDKARDEAKLQVAVKANKALAAKTGNPWKSIEQAEQVYAGLYLPYSQIEGGGGFASTLFRYARALVRGTVEREKPSSDRLPEYSDNRLPRIAQQLSAAVPVYPHLEKLTLSFSLERMRELLGPDNPLVRQLLAHDSPDTLAARLVDGSKLNDPLVRKKLWDEGAAAVKASSDPMIQLARTIDGQARALRKQYEDEVEAPIRAASQKIAAARFAILGTSVYPDATFTLRLNDGSVQGWNENGTEIAPFTHLNRLYERATGKEPFKVPERWLNAKSQLDMNTPFNLSTNNDIVGGNSGSPLVNARGEIVGLMFDGNIHSISGAFWFDNKNNRAVAVDTTIIREALKKVYHADGLLQEMQGLP